MTERLRSAGSPLMNGLRQRRTRCPAAHDELFSSRKLRLARQGYSPWTSRSGGTVRSVFAPSALPSKSTTHDPLNTTLRARQVAERRSARRAGWPALRKPLGRTAVNSALEAWRRNDRAGASRWTPRAKPQLARFITPHQALGGAALEALKARCKPDRARFITPRAMRWRRGRVTRLAKKPVPGG